MAIADRIRAATNRVIESGWYVLGDEGANFETQFAEFTGCKHAIGVASGTDAITLALMALSIGNGDEVITTALTAYPTITAITRSGATPIIADIHATDGLINPEHAASLITPRTKAIVAVHLYGKCCDMGALRSICQHHHIALIEDCAQACGASAEGQLAGSMGDLGCFSFYPTKNLGALGDGGAITTDSDDIAKRLRMLRNYGQSDRYHHQHHGVNSRLDEMQAAILCAKLPLLTHWNQRRREIASTYHQHLSMAVNCLSTHDDQGHIYHLFAIRVKNRNLFMETMRCQGVQTLIHYPIAVHQQPAMAASRAQASPCPVAEQLATEVVSLPLYPEMTDEEVAAVSNAVLISTEGREHHG